KVSLMLEILSRRFFLKLNLSDHKSILMDLQGTLKGKWRYLILAITPIHNHVLIPNYQDFKIQDFRYSDGFECFQAINIGRYEHATAIVHHHSIRFKMNNKKRIVNLKHFREMLQICPRIPNQQFDELPFKEEILAFLRELGYSGGIKMITDVNINKLHQPWRSFAAVINKCPSGKSTEHKDAKKSNEMYYHRFTKVIINFFMTKDQSIPNRKKNTKQYGAILLVELTNEAIKNSKYYKEYYVIASGAEPPKTKASIRKKQSSFDTTMPPLTIIGKRLNTLAKMGQPAKEKQPAKSSKAKGPTVLSEVPDVPTYESDDEEMSWKSSEDDDDDDDDEVKISEHDNDVDDQNNDGDDFIHPKFSSHHEEDKDEESFDSIVQTPSQVENTDDEDNNEDSHGMNVEGNEGGNEEDDADELYRDVNIYLEGRDIQMSSSVSSCFISNMLNPSPDTGIDSIFESTPRVDVLVMTTAELPLLSTITLPPPSIPIISHVQQTPFDHRLKTLETNFSKFMQTNQSAEAISLIPGIVDKYIDHRMNEAVKVAVRLQSDRHRDEAQAKNKEFLNKIDENIQKIIKEQVKEQFKVQVSKILPKIKKTVNEQLEAEVLTCLFNSSKTSHAVAADLYELELKKILIDKMESNKSIHRSDEQKNLYKALVNAYECDNLILDTYGDAVTLKRR
nr:hypothetical protein [Tanacetum cinerariifolium]